MTDGRSRDVSAGRGSAAQLAPSRVQGRTEFRRSALEIQYLSSWSAGYEALEVNCDSIQPASRSTHPSYCAKLDFRTVWAQYHD